jgi:hypothetical protein
MSTNFLFSKGDPCRYKGGHHFFLLILVIGAKVSPSLALWFKLDGDRENSALTNTV